MTIKLPTVKLPPCPDCGLRPRYHVDGKWSTHDKIMTLRLSPSSIKIRPQHTWNCRSEDNCIRHRLRMDKLSRARGI